MIGGQSRQLIAADVEQRISAYKERVSSFLGK
jgi:hypothetical protein